MSISLNSRLVSSSHVSDSNGDNQTIEITKLVGIAVQASTLAEQILALTSSPSRCSLAGSNTPPIVEDMSIYSNKQLAGWAKIDETVTYRYVMKEFAIYGTTAEECREVYNLYLNLDKTAQGKLIQQLMAEEIKQNRLFLFGHPGTRIGKSFGLFGQNFFRQGNFYDSAIIIPIKKPQLAKELHWCHEASHYLVSRCTKNRSTCPISDLSLKAQNQFMGKYHEIRQGFLNNPHPLGTLPWKWHEYLKSHLFEKPLTLYQDSKHATEIFAHTMECELALPGLLKRQGLSEMDMLMQDVLFNQRSLPSAVLEHLPKEGFPLSSLNSAGQLPKGLSGLRRLGNGIKGFLGKVAPFLELPIEIVFNFQPGEEHALMHAIRDGSASWTIGTSMNLAILATFGWQVAAAFGVASMAAEMAPDMHKWADSLDPMEILSRPELKDLPEHLKQIMNDQLSQARAYILCLAMVQDGFKALNPIRIWQKIMPLQEHDAPSATWTSGVFLNLLMASTLKTPFKITFELSPKANELAPDFGALARAFPDPHLIFSNPDFNDLPPHMKLAMRDYIFQARNGLQFLGILQTAFAHLTPQRIWQEINSHPIVEPPMALPGQQEDPIDAFLQRELYPYFTDNQSRGSSLTTPSSFVLPDWTSNTKELRTLQPNFQNCVLGWQVASRGKDGVATVETQFVIPNDSLNELAAVTDEVALSCNSVEKPLTTHVNQTGPSEEQMRDIIAGSYMPIQSTEKEEIKKPSFAEQAMITDVRIGITASGASGIILSVCSGSQVCISVTAEGISVTCTVPFSQAFLTTLGTGLLYAAPIAAVIISAQLLFKAYQNGIKRHLKKDVKKSENEMDAVQNIALPAIDYVLEQFSKGEIDKQDFLAQINEIAHSLNRAGHHMGKRGNYSNKHDIPSFGYFSKKSYLEQLELDLRAMKKDALIKHDVESNYAPELKQKPTSQLINDLFNISGIVSPKDKYQQDALKKEIASRIESEGDLTNLSNIEALSQKPAATSLNPRRVSKPKHISADNIAGKSKKHRRKNKMMDWANSLDKKYKKFLRAAKNGASLEKLEELAKAVMEEIARTDGSHDVNLSEYELKGRVATAADYYNGFISLISHNVNDTLNKARALENGQVTAETPALFSQGEIDALRFNAALKQFQQSSKCLEDDSQDSTQKGIAYQERLAAAQILMNLNSLASNPEEFVALLAPILTIGTQYPSYESYTSTLERLSTLKKGVESFDSAVRDAVKEDQSAEESAKAWETANEQAKQLLALNITPQDIINLTGKSAEEAAKIAEEINQQANGICTHYTIRIYESQMPYIYNPASWMILHCLSDLERFDRFESLTVPIRLLAAAHAFAPDILPTVLALPAAYAKGDGAVVKDLLVWKFQNTYMRAHKIATLVATLVRNGYKAVLALPAVYLRGDRQIIQYYLSWENIKNTYGKAINILTRVYSGNFDRAKLEEASSLLHCGNVAVQVGSSALTFSTKRVFGSTQIVKRFNTGVRFTASSIDVTSSLVHYSNLSAHVCSLSSVGTLLAKFSEVAPGLLSLASSVADVYELMATNLDVIKRSKEWVITKSLKETIKGILPDLSGKLPENSFYYGAKDLILSAVYGSMSMNPIMLGMALFQGASSLYNYLSGRYEDRVLCSIMQNYCYRHRLSPTPEIEEAQASSIINLQSRLKESFIALPSDSKVKKSARAFFFDYHIRELEKKGAIPEILLSTALEFDSEKGSVIFTKANIEVWDATNVLLRRFSALLRFASSDNELFASSYKVIKKELSGLRAYFIKKYVTTAKHKRKKIYETVKSLIQCIDRVKFYCKILYLEKIEDKNQLLYATRLDWDKNTFSTCVFRNRTGNAIDVEDVIDLFFKRCQVFYQKMYSEPEQASQIYDIAGEEIMLVITYLDIKAESLNQPDFLKEVRKELCYQTREAFISCFLAHYLSGAITEYDGDEDSIHWTVLRMFDSLSIGNRDVIQWLALSQAFKAIGTDSARYKSGLSSLQMNCFFIICEVLEEKIKTGKATEFDMNLYEIFLKIKEEHSDLHYFEQESPFKADSDLLFYDLVRGYKRQFHNVLSIANT